MYKIIALLVSILLSTSIYSQEDKVKISISGDQVIIDKDTLLIGITGLTDILEKTQIDSLGMPSEVQWDGDCDSGMYYSYLIKRKACEYEFTSESNIAYMLENISIKDMDLISLSIENQLIKNRLTHEVLINLGFVREYRYKPKNSKIYYLKKGIHLTTFKETDDSLFLKSMHIHPKSWDKHLALTNLRGTIRNSKGELLPGTILLAYDELDSLKYEEITDINGYFNFNVEKVNKLDILNANCQFQTIGIKHERYDPFDITLDFQRYELPDLIISKKRKFEYDISCFRDQFPEVRDTSKINVLVLCEFGNFNPLIYKIPKPLRGYDYMYSELVGGLQKGKRIKHCQADVFFVIEKDGSVSIEKIEGAEKINKEKLARSISQTFQFTPLTWRGRRCESYWKLRIVFE